MDYGQEADPRISHSPDALSYFRPVCAGREMRGASCKYLILADLLSLGHDPRAPVYRAGGPIGSPPRSVLGTWTLSFKLPSPLPRQPKSAGIHRNPVVLAKEMQAALESGNGDRPCDLAAELGLSRARVTQLLRLLRLAPSTIEAIERLGDRWETRIVGEHTLRGFVDLPEARQIQAVQDLINSRDR